MWYRRLYPFGIKNNDYMKLFCLILVLTLFIQAGNAHNESIKSLWKAYSEASKADLPEKQADILLKIKNLSFSQKRAWDFYNASDKYISVMTSKNWKLRDSLVNKLEEEIKEFNIPIVSYSFDRYYKWLDNKVLSEKMKSNKDKLISSVNKDFYSSDYIVEYGLGGKLKDYIANDYEYVLWSLNSQELKDFVKGRYPNEAYYDFICIKNDKKAFEDFAKKYEGKGVSFYALAEVLRLEFEELEKKQAKSDDFVTFLKKCREFEKERLSLKGEEKEIASGITIVKTLISALNRKDARFEISGDKAEIILRNLSQISVKIYKSDSSEIVLKKELLSENSWFYIPDTLKLNLSELKDGNYRAFLQSGDYKTESYFQKYSVYLAMFRDAQKAYLYASDNAGKPLENFTISLFYKNKEVERFKDLSCKNGFIPFPKELDKSVDIEQEYQIQAFYDADMLKKSRKVYYPSYWEGNPNENSNANIYLDRGVYNPGDTVKFKAILYNSDKKGNTNVVGAGKSVKVYLKDSEWNKLDELNLCTNDFGALAGSFVLPKEHKNGSFNIYLEAEPFYESVDFTVAEFVVPSFDLKFNDYKQVYLSKDTVRISGKVTAASGHKLSSASLNYNITNDNNSFKKGKTVIDAQGNFAFDFVPVEAGWYSIDIILSDILGETNEFNHTVSVVSILDLDIGSKDLLEGEFATKNYKGYSILTKDKPVFTVSCPYETKINYNLRDSRDSVVISGTTLAGESICLDLSSLKSDVYSFVAEAVAGEQIKGKNRLEFLKISESEKYCPHSVDYFFFADKNIVDYGNDLHIRFGVNDGPVQANILLYNGQSTVGKMIRVERGEVLDYFHTYKYNYPDAISLKLFYFKKGYAYEFSKIFNATKKHNKLGLTLSSFENKLLPGKQYTFEFNADRGVEVMASIYDKGLDAFEENTWTLEQSRQRYFDNIPINHNGEFDRNGLRSYSFLAKETVEDCACDEHFEDIIIRNVFSNSLAFEPFLYPDKQGKVSLKFKTSDKLSTYCVRVYAHDKNMNSKILSKDFVVSLPVKVDATVPQYLYAGDKYSLAVSLSSLADNKVKGKMYLYQYEGTDYVNSNPIKTLCEDVAVDAEGTYKVMFDIDVPEKLIVDKTNEIGIKVLFADDEKQFSDGMFVTIPVLNREQTLTEVHSAILKTGDDKRKMVEKLEKEFVNVSPYGAEYSEKSVKDILDHAFEGKLSPTGNDVLSLIETYYIAIIKHSFEQNNSQELLDKIFTCRNEDGGFAWFQGMKSSPVITAVVLEYFAKFIQEGRDLSSSVKYLDRKMLDTAYYGIPIDNYLYIRSMYSFIPFDVKPFGEPKYFKQRLNELKKDVKHFIDKGKNKGNILTKAKRISTLMNLSSVGAGLAFSQSLGLKINKKSLPSEIASLSQYAVNHKDGGIYFPNAVMPFRGLLESEAYAHTLLCRIFSDYALSGNPLPVNAAEIADGIRHWLILQKETQQWRENTGFIEAFSEIISGGDHFMNTKIALMKKSYAKPLNEIKAAGNGFKIERKLYRENDGTQVLSGTFLQKGEKIRAEYAVWSAENRSFVKITIPREATLIPAQQLSGITTLGSYRNVKTDKTEYYFDTLPEENITITETYYVTQTGQFSSPVANIECTYAPHYKANAGFTGSIEIK